MRRFDHGITYVSAAERAVRGRGRWIEVDRPRPGDRPACGARRSSWASRRFSRSSTRTWTATARRSSRSRARSTGELEPLTAPTLAAFSIGDRKAVWRKNKLMAFYRPMPAVPVRDWPLAADLDGDGRAEIVIPHVDSLDSAQCRVVPTGACGCSTAPRARRAGIVPSGPV